MGFELAGEVFAPAIVGDREIRDHFGKFLPGRWGPNPGSASRAGSWKIPDQDARQTRRHARALVAIRLHVVRTLLAAAWGRGEVAVGGPWGRGGPSAAGAGARLARSVATFGQIPDSASWTLISQGVLHCECNTLDLNAPAAKPPRTSIAAKRDLFAMTLRRSPSAASAASARLVLRSDHRAMRAVIYRSAWRSTTWGPMATTPTRCAMTRAWPVPGPCDQRRRLDRGLGPIKVTAIRSRRAAARAGHIAFEMHGHLHQAATRRLRLTAEAKRADQRRATARTRPSSWGVNNETRPQMTWLVSNGRARPCARPDCSRRWTPARHRSRLHDHHPTPARRPADLMTTSTPDSSLGPGCGCHVDDSTSTGAAGPSAL